MYVPWYIISLLTSCEERLRLCHLCLCSINYHIYIHITYRLYIIFYTTELLWLITLQLVITTFEEEIKAKAERNQPIDAVALKAKHIISFFHYIDNRLKESLKCNEYSLLFKSVSIVDILSTPLNISEKERQDRLAQLISQQQQNQIQFNSILQKCLSRYEALRSKFVSTSARGQACGIADMLQNDYWLRRPGRLVLGPPWLMDAEEHWRRHIAQQPNEAM